MDRLLLTGKDRGPVADQQTIEIVFQKTAQSFLSLSDIGIFFSGQQTDGAGRLSYQRVADNQYPLPLLNE